MEWRVESVQCKVWNLWNLCKVSSVKCEVESVECKGWNV